METEKYFEDLWFYVVAEPGDYRVEFKIYEVEGRTDDGGLLFHKEGAMSSPSFEENMEDAEVYASGHVKWDGCSNWDIDENARSMLHFCSKQQAINLGLVLGECYNMASYLCGHWDGV